MLHRALAGDDWTLDQHLLAIVVDRLGLGNWQRQGKRGSPRPKPISPLARAKGRRVGNTAGRSDEEVVALLHAHRTGALEKR